jgi:hypothetical protein
MKITHYIQPRCSGKTTEVIKRFKESPETSLLIVGKEFKKHYVNNYDEILFKYKNRIKEVGDPILGINKISKVYVDEFLLRPCYNLTENMSPYLNQSILNVAKPGAEIFLYSTPQKIYSREAYALASISNMISNDDVRMVDQFDSITCKILKRLNNPNLLNEIESLHDSYLIPTHNIEVISKGEWGFGMRSKAEHLEMVGKERYELDVLVKYIKD